MHALVTDAGADVGTGNKHRQQAKAARKRIRKERKKEEGQGSFCSLLSVLSSFRLRFFLCFLMRDEKINTEMVSENLQDESV